MNIGIVLIVIGFIFNFLETWYFGWNIEPSCPKEMVCDYISIALLLAGTIAILKAVVR